MGVADKVIKRAYFLFFFAASYEVKAVSRGLPLDELIADHKPNNKCFSDQFSGHTREPVRIYFRTFIDCNASQSRALEDGSVRICRVFLGYFVTC